MRSIIIFLFFGVSAFLLFSCDHNDKEDFQMDQLTLPYGQMVNHEGAAWLLTDSILDSRCPTDYVCVWEGVVQGQITMDIAGELHYVPFQVKGLCDPSLNSCGNVLDTLGYHIQFISMDPYPVEFNNIPQQDYILKLEVEKL